MVVRTYSGIYPINLDFLIYAKERTITALAFDSYVEAFYKVFTKSMNFFEEKYRIRKVFYKRAFDFNKRLHRHRERIFEKFENNICNVKVDSRIVELFKSKNVDTVIKELTGDDDASYEKMYIYSNKKYKLVLKDKLVVIFKDVEFFRKLEYELYENNELVMKNKYIISRIKNKNKKLKVHTVGDCSLVHYLYKIMRDKECERTIFLSSSRKVR